MTVNYALYPNKLTDEPGTYLARVQAVSIVELEEVIERMLERDNTIGRSDIMAVLDVYHDTITKMVLDGIKVKTPLAHYHVSMSGVYESKSSPFDSSKHRVLPVVNAGSLYREAIRRDVHIHRQRAGKRLPVLDQFVDNATGERNGALTPGGMGQLQGDLLKFDPSDPQQGVFAINGGAPQRMQAVSRNVSSEIIFLVDAALPPGDYTLQVRTILKGNKELRVGELDQVLVVE